METKAWDAVIIGAGISGLEAANRLGNLGYEILLTEKQEALGGHARLYNCKAVQDRCTKCNACLINDKIQEVLANKRVVPMVGTTLQGLEREGMSLRLTFQKDGNLAYARSRCLILSHGFEDFDPSTQKNLAYSKSPNIITALEAESILKKKGMLIRPSDDEEPKSICFIQCVGSRNKTHPYCSKICCGYAIRMAQLIKNLQPEVKITFFYMDIQTYQKDFVESFPEVKRQFEFIRQIPGELIPVQEDRISLYAKIEGKIQELTFDMAILSTGIAPPKLSFRLEDQVFKTNSLGFLETEVQKGIFALGTATGPKSIPDCIADVRRALPEIVSYLEATHG